MPSGPVRAGGGRGGRWLLPALLRPAVSTGAHPPLWFSSLLADKWGSEEVAAWLEALGLGEYKDIFVRHDIQGSELILLERRDLKVQSPLCCPAGPPALGSMVASIPPLPTPPGGAGRGAEGRC